MPGRMGAERVTIQNLEIVKVDADQNIILVKGAVPGPKKSLVMLKESVKAYPIVVNVGPGDFTDTGHFMVITGYDDEGFSINDAFSIHASINSVISG